MGMQGIPTFKSMNLTAPMANQQMVLKRGNDYITNMIASWQLANGTNANTGIMAKGANGVTNLATLQDIMAQIAGRKNATPFGMGWINEMPQNKTK